MFLSLKNSSQDLSRFSPMKSLQKEGRHTIHHGFFLYSSRKFCTKAWRHDICPYTRTLTHTPTTHFCLWISREILACLFLNAGKAQGTPVNSRIVTQESSRWHEQPHPHTCGCILTRQPRNFFLRFGLKWNNRLHTGQQNTSPACITVKKSLKFTLIRSV